MHPTLKIIKEEHETIEEYLKELEVIIDSEEINFPNLIHVLKQLTKLWDKHEKREAIFFAYLKQKNYSIPYKKILFDHGQLRKDRIRIEKSLSIGTEGALRRSMQVYGKDILERLRKHMYLEDEVLYRLPEE